MKRNFLGVSIICFAICFAICIFAIAHATTIKDDMTFEGPVTINGALTIDADSIDGTASDAVRQYSVQIPSLFVDGTGPITSASAPNCTTVDNVVAAVYDNSGETAEIQFTHAASSAFKGLTIKVPATSSGATGSEQALDWSIFVQDNDGNIGTEIAQTGASYDSTTMDAAIDEVTLTLDATGIAAVTGGTSVITIATWNNGTSDNTLEIKGIKVREL
jgi:hypothetical protein